MLPIALRGEGRCALIVGGGSVAQRKAEALKAAGFTVRFSHAYSAADLRDADVVVAATDDGEVNARVVTDARAAHILVCDASDPGRGDFTMLANARVGELTFAVDSGRSTPAFAKRLVREIRERFDPRYDSAARTLARMRTYVMTVLPGDERAPVLRELAEMPIDELAAMDPVHAEHVVESVIERLRGQGTSEGTRAAVCATRASALALTQARLVAARLAQGGTATTLLTLTTTGDRVTDRPIAAIGTDNVWVKELEAALIDGRADYAVHSCKDLPGTLADGMQLVAITQREDPRDAFCSERFASFEDLPLGSVVGTSSPRRRAQLRALRPDLCFEDIRGNVDTRLRKLRDGRYDAIVLAMAGLHRLGARATHTVPFPAETIVPAVAQGALAVETRTGASYAAHLRTACNDTRTELCVTAERAALRSLRAGCNAPLGIHARLEDGTMTIEAAYGIEERSLVVRERLTAPLGSLDDAAALGERLAAALSERLREDARRLVVLARTQDRPSRIAAHLRSRGIEVVELRHGETIQARPPDMLIFPSSGSVAAARAYLDGLMHSRHRPKVAAMGAQSGAAARAAGFTPDITAPDASIDAFVTCIVEELNGK